MRYWWANQNQTYDHEIEGGFLWSPKTSRDGRRNQFYENMTEVAPGDVIFSFAARSIAAIGRAAGTAVSRPKPDFGSVGEQWSSDGWMLPVKFTRLRTPFRPKDIIDQLRPHLTAKYSPLRPNGNGNQCVYLAEISQPFAEVLFRHAGVDAPAAPSIDSGQETALGKRNTPPSIASAASGGTVNAMRGILTKIYSRLLSA